MSKRKTEVNFEELSKLSRERREPCGKVAYSLSQANYAVKVRNALNDGRVWHLYPCFGQCGGNVFHLSTKRKTGKFLTKINPKVKPKTLAQTLKKRRKRIRSAENARRVQTLAIGNWLDDGGALHPSELED